MIALQRLVEGTADTDGGLRSHVTILKAIEKASSDKLTTVRAACGLAAQALATACLGFVTVKLPSFLALCSKAGQRLNSHC